MNQHTWIDDNDSHLAPINDTPNQTAITSTGKNNDLERYEDMLPGILITKGVDVARTSQKG